MHVHRLGFAALVLLAVLNGPTSLAAQGPRPAAAPATTSFAVTPTQGLPLAQFLRLVSRELRYPMTCSPAARKLIASPTKRVHIHWPVTLPRANVRDFTRNVLSTMGLRINQSGSGPGSFYVVAVSEPCMSSPGFPCHVTEKELIKYRDANVLVACLVRLKHIKTRRLQDRIRRSAAVSGPLVMESWPTSDESAVVLLGFAPFVYRELRQVRALDVAGSTPTRSESHRVEKAKEGGGAEQAGHP